MKDVIVIQEGAWREDGRGRESLYRSHEDAFSRVSMIVPCTNLNIDILNREKSRDRTHKGGKLPIRF